MEEHWIVVGSWNLRLPAQKAHGFFDILTGFIVLAGKAQNECSIVQRAHIRWLSFHPGITAGQNIIEFFSVESFEATGL